MSKPDPLSVIECGKCYRLPEFLKLAKMGDRALREAKDKGFCVIYVGRLGWVRGDDFHAFLGQLKEEQEAAQKSQSTK